LDGHPKKWEKSPIRGLLQSFKQKCGKSRQQNWEIWGSGQPGPKKSTFLVKNPHFSGIFSQKWQFRGPYGLDWNPEFPYGLDWTAPKKLNYPSSTKLKVNINLKAREKKVENLVSGQP
jgi:hypothetical protein